jgi:hypothetical protein
MGRGILNRAPAKRGNPLSENLTAILHPPNQQLVVLTVRQSPVWKRQLPGAMFKPSEIVFSANLPLTKITDQGNTGGVGGSFAKNPGIIAKVQAKILVA